MANAQRLHPLKDQLFAGNKVLIKPEAPQTRISLRVGENDIAKVEKILGMKLPQKPKNSATSKTRTAMWLGPDEWLILDKSSSSLRNLPHDLTKILCSAVDVSHRNTAITVTGANAVNVLNAGCPQNLSLTAFPINACSRTIYGKSEIILVRIADNEFHVECWRSFSNYVWKYLVDAAKTV